MGYLNSLIDFFRGFGATHWFAFVSTVVILAYVIITDIPLAMNRVQGDTYSETIRAMASQHIVVPAFAGVVMGHWMWPGPVWLSGWQTIAILSALTILLLALDIAHAKWGWAIVLHLEKNPQEVFALFFLIGHYVWSQGPTP